MNTLIHVVLCLCFFTVWGLKRKRAWSRWTGIAACLLLLVFTPWLTVLGASGLILIWRCPTDSVPASEAEEYWKPGRQTLLGEILYSIIFMMTMVVGGSYFYDYGERMNRVSPFAHSSGLVVTSAVAVIVVGLILNAAIHEVGHALAAWLVDYRIEAWNAGAFTLFRTPTGWRSHFDWKRLLSTGGYVGAVPTSEQHVRAKEIFVIAAGPLTSLTAAMAITLWFLQLPGTVFAPFFLYIGIITLEGYYCGIASLIPTGGYEDGTMLVHLIFRTNRGDELLDAILARHRTEEANRRRLVGETGTLVIVRRAALDRLMKSRRPDPVELSKAHAQLGFAELSSGAYRSAEESFRRGLAVLPPAGDTAREAECHIGLHRIALLCHRAAEADAAYRAAARALEKQIGPNAPGSLAIALQLAELHTHAREFERALEQIELVLPRLSDSPRNLRARALLLRWRGHCELQLGHRENGVASLEQAVDLWCSRGSQLPDAPKQLCSIAIDFWNGGQAETGITLLRDAIALLEGRGEHRVAAQKRIVLTDCLCRDGQNAEAEQALPDPALVEEGRRRGLLEQQAAIHLKAGRAGEALADYREFFRLTQADPEACDASIAAAQALLAKAHLSAGDSDVAEKLALEAWRNLSGAGHPEASSCCVTLAILSYTERRDPREWLDEGLRRLEESVLLRGNKVRSLDNAADRLEKAGLRGGAERYRAAADKHWHYLGVSRNWVYDSGVNCGLSGHPQIR
jgi:tetratricopeptide (TPR) repeat protein